MKTIYITTFLCLIVLSVTFGKASPPYFIFQDAQLLRDLKNKNDSDSKRDFWAILKKYEIDLSNITSNPFYDSSAFSGMNLVGVSSVDVKVAEFQKNDLASVVSPVSFESTVINGVALFMEKRFRQELAAYFVKELRDRFEKDLFIQTLLPKTFKFLQLFSESVYTTDFTLFKLAAEEDYRNAKIFVPNALLILSELKYKNKDSIFKIEPKDAESLGYLAAVIQIVILVENSKNDLGSILNGLETIQGLPPSVKEYISIIRTASNALYDPDARAYYNLSQIDIASLNRLEVRYFYVLLYHRLSKQMLNGNPLIPNFINADTTEQKNLAKNLTNLVIEIEKLIDLQGKTNFLDKIAVISSTSENVIKAINDFRGIGNLPQWVNRGSLLSSFTNFVKVVEEVSSALPTDDQHFKRYGLIMANLAFFLTDLQKNIKDEQSKANTALATIIRNISIVAQIAEIKKAEDMASLLESVALPVGSSSIKRNARFNFALNGYVGANVGFDYYGKGMGSNRTNTKFNGGLTAPIGLSLSRSSITATKSIIASYTFFVSFLDLGNLVNYRLQLNSDTTKKTEIGGLKFKYFQYYGAGVLLNFRKSPLSFGLHGGYMPGFKDAMIDGIKINDISAFKINATLLVDIPFFNIVTTNK